MKHTALKFVKQTHSPVGTMDFVAKSDSWTFCPRHSEFMMRILMNKLFLLIIMHNFESKCGKTKTIKKNYCSSFSALV